MTQLTTDIIDWALAADGDLDVGQDVRWTAGLAAVAQSCQIAVSMIRAEWFLDDLEGVPYWERPGVPAADALLGQPFNSLRAIAAFRDALTSVPQVITIRRLEVAIDKATGKLRVSWAVRTTFGDTPGGA